MSKDCINCVYLKQRDGYMGLCTNVHSENFDKIVFDDENCNDILLWAEKKS